MTPEIRENLERLPTGAGVYLMRSADGEVFYVGKATNLRSRVRSYFGGRDPRAFVAHLDELLHAIEVRLTRNAKEALLLENTLIKKFRPRFNVMLRDDKNYPSLRIDAGGEWPRVEVVRRISKDGARYFGPFHSAQSVRRTLHLLNRYFRLRTCPDHVMRNRVRPCLQHQIGRCPAPCVPGADASEYARRVRDAMLFLSGRTAQLSRELTGRMEKASEAMEYEEAARYRDQIRAIETTLVPQLAVQTVGVDRDVVGWAREGGRVACVVLAFREGSLGDIPGFLLSVDEALGEDEGMMAFLSQYYARADRTPPEVVTLPFALADASDLESALSEMRGEAVRFSVPTRGDELQLVELAHDNAVNWLRAHASDEARSAEAAERLADFLGLPTPPGTIECYDVSNLQGERVVASRVVFAGGEPARARYRRYLVRSVEGQDDFAAMQEILLRRARSAASGDDPMPDLIVIDGGRGQLARAQRALADYGQHDVPVIGLAKARSAGADATGEVIHSPERVFAPGWKEPRPLRARSPERLLLERLRDEAHRVAISYHRNLRDADRLNGELDRIRGVGETRRRALLRHFGSVDAVAGAALTELEAVAGMTRASARAVFDFFHPGESDMVSYEDVYTDVSDQKPAERS